jgi:ribosomal protein S18 acetylase RimI-like enzyme
MRASAEFNMIEYRKNHQLDPNDVVRVFDASGITRPTHDVGRIGRMFKNSNLIVSAWADGKLIGICRALTDFSYCCYLSDLAVDKAYQKKGIGREMIRHVEDAIGEEVSLILLSAPNAMSYYPNVGFDKIENGFIIKRKR